MDNLSIKLSAEVDFDVVTPFKVGDKDFIALIPKQDIYIFRTREIPSDDTIEILVINDKKEYEAARDVLDYLITNSDIENE